VTRDGPVPLPAVISKLDGQILLKYSIGDASLGGVSLRVNQSVVEL
jgi:hypothetical protein